MIESPFVTKFTDLGLADPLLKALASKGYSDPTPIQRQSIPPLLQGRDLCGIAQTGTGKTAAFALPSLQYFMNNPKPRPLAGCRMLVLSPTRELASQIATSFRDYGRFLQLSVETVFGGVPVGRQISKLRAGVDILVATPGRLLDLIDQRALTLKDVEIFVLDEADQMLDLGFIHALKRIDKLLPRKRQTLFFSATMPKTIAELGDRFLTDPVKVSVAPQSTTAERVQQRATFVNQAEKQALLHLILKSEDIDRALIFTRTKHGADRVVRFLEGAGIEAFAIHINQAEKQALLTLTLQAEPIDRALVFTRTKHGADRVVKHLHAAGIGCAAIHGNKSQPQRTQALQAFRSGEIKILVATDIAARGIDVSGVSHVFNFELPNVPEQYVHRIGRTARAGREGIAVSFVAEDERPYLRAIERLTRVRLDPMPLPENFDARKAALPKPSAPVRQHDPRAQQRGPRANPAREGERTPGGDRPKRPFRRGGKSGVGAHKGAVRKFGQR